MERNYTTQMDAARRGIVTPELETVARKERMTVEELMPPGGLRQGGHPGQPPAQVPGCGGHRLYAPHQNQREPGRLPGLQGLRCRDAESNGSCKHGRPCYHGSFFPRKYHSVPTQADIRVSGNDRNRSGL